MKRYRKTERLPRAPSRSSNSTGDVSSTSIEVPLSELRFQSLFSPVRSHVLSEIEDRRLWHPEEDAPVRSPRRHQVQVVLAPAAKKPILKAYPVGKALRIAQGANFKPPLSSRPQLAFKHPAPVAVCVRRHQRREVLLAKGKGGSHHRRSKPNKLSHIRC